MLINDGTISCLTKHADSSAPLCYGHTHPSSTSTSIIDKYRSIHTNHISIQARYLFCSNIKCQFSCFLSWLLSTAHRNNNMARGLKWLFKSKWLMKKCCLNRHIGLLFDMKKGVYIGLDVRHNIE